MIVSGRIACGAVPDCYVCAASKMLFRQISDPAGTDDDPMSVNLSGR
jgi:hypothetical protein